MIKIVRIEYKALTLLVNTLGTYMGRLELPDQFFAQVSSTYIESDDMPKKDWPVRLLSAYQYNLLNKSILAAQSDITTLY